MLRHNQLLQAMIIPTAIGTAMYSLKTVVSYIFRTHISPRLYSYITIHSAESDYFEAVLDFIQANKLLKANHFVACRPKIGGGETGGGDDESSSSSSLISNVHYRPADSGDTVSMLYKGRTIYISRKAGETLTVGYERAMIRLETLSLSVLGTDSSILKTMISDAIERVNNIKTENTRIFVQFGCYDRWTVVLSKKPRSPESVLLDKTISQGIIDDARNFIRSGQWYEDMGIPHRRGYLLHGPPGCGKTSFCQVLASALGYDICILSLSDRFTTDNTLANGLRNAPLRSIVLLEDVDAVFTQSREKKTGGVVDAAAVSSPSSSLTFSGLLNAIDGVVSQEGRILVMTTNHIEKLDPALIRPGRCDVKVMFDNASSEQIVAMFLRFFPGCDKEDAVEFASTIITPTTTTTTNVPTTTTTVGKVSMAQIQCHLVSHRHSAREAIETASESMLLLL
jgi:chaperone BCS1